ncbi:hypothetical protein [Humibacter sp.]|uniref:hypothetical protein n=1 Tax=Humibacter sp. TaxID=1940291 RepID=UPI003F7D7B58
MSDYLACAAGCTIRDEHLTSCDGFKRIGGEYVTCTGCVPKPAAFGCLCARDWYALELAWSEWAILEPYLVRYARLSPRNTDGARSPAGPSVPLPQTALSADEVRSWLRDEPQNARSWVSTVEGAQHAVGFTRAVQRAARAHQIAEKPRKLQRMRCQDCGQLVAWMPPAGAFQPLTVKCEGCGREITEEQQWQSYRRTGDGWESYEQAAIDIVAEIETGRKSVMSVMNDRKTA